MHVQIKHSLTHMQDLIPTLVGAIASMKVTTTGLYVDSFHAFKISHHKYVQTLIVRKHNLLPQCFCLILYFNKFLSSSYHTDLKMANSKSIISYMVSITVIPYTV